MSERVQTDDISIKSKGKLNSDEIDRYAKKITMLVFKYLPLDKKFQIYNQMKKAFSEFNFDEEAISEVLFKMDVYLNSIEDDVTKSFSKSCDMLAIFIGGVYLDSCNGNRDPNEIYYAKEHLDHASLILGYCNLGKLLNKRYLPLVNCFNKESYRQKEYLCFVLQDSPNYKSNKCTKH